MNVHPIRTEADYDAALASVETLWGSKVGTSEGDHLDVLLVLIENYEARNHPIDPPDPGVAHRAKRKTRTASRRR